MKNEIIKLDPITTKMLLDCITKFKKDDNKNKINIGMSDKTIAYLISSTEDFVLSYNPILKTNQVKEGLRGKFYEDDIYSVEAEVGVVELSNEKLKSKIIKLSF